MKKFLALIVVAVMSLAFSVDSSAQLSRLHFKSYKIASINPLSTRSCDGAVQLSLRNDTTAFTMSRISGVAYKNGRPFVKGSAKDVSIPAGNVTTTVSGNVTLCDGITIWTVLGCLFGFNASDYTIDINMTIRMSTGEVRDFSKQGMSVAAVLNNYHQRK